MHISFLTSEYPDKTKIAGGIATSIKTLAKGLVDSGHQVTVFIYGQNMDTSYIEDGIYFVNIKIDSRPMLTWWTNRRKIEKCINQYTHMKNIDLIEVPDWTGITATMHLDIPIVIRLHGSDTYFCKIEGRKQKWKNYFFEKLALKNANYIISVSKFAADKTCEFFQLQKDIKIIPNGVNIEEFKYESSSVSSKQIILYLGTLIRKKGVLDLAEIFNKVVEKNKNVTLRLIGADASDALSGSASTWDLMRDIFTPEAFSNVEYLGKISHNEVTQQVKEATVCVFPSYAEAFPIAWLEAMASGKAIVASNIGWATECLEDTQSALLEYPANHNAFADKIIDILNDKELANKLGKNARARVEIYFSIQKIVEKNINYYTNIIEKGIK